MMMPAPSVNVSVMMRPNMISPRLDVGSSQRLRIDEVPSTDMVFPRGAPDMAPSQTTGGRPSGYRTSAAMFPVPLKIGGVTALIDWLADHWRLAAIAALFFVGVVMRRTGVAGAPQGRWLLNFVFHV